MAFCSGCGTLVDTPFCTNCGARQYTSSRRERSALGYFIEPYRKYADFNGRARRKEYWWFTLFSAIVSAIVAFSAMLFVAFIGGASSVPEQRLDDLASDWASGAFILYWLGTWLPALAVTVRRLHDTGRSGWWVLLNLIPYVGATVVLIFCCLDSQPGGNEYGPNPKELVA